MSKVRYSPISPELEKELDTFIQAPGNCIDMCDAAGLTLLHAARFAQFFEKMVHMWQSFRCW